jgi:glycosyltransferase involved in cell wall biosynthesis
MPKVSVILAAYNAQQFLPATMDSLLRQTFTDFEIVAIDDGSQDSTGQILDTYAAKDARVRVIHKANGGQVRAAIDGIAASTAPLIARMDADDIAVPDRLSKQVAFMDAYPEVVLLGGAYQLIDEKSRLLTTIPQPTDDATLQNICLTGRCPICQPLAMFRRDAYEKTMGYRPDFSPAEDIDLWLQLGEIGQLACLPDVLLQYRQHGNSLSEKKQQLQIDNQREACRQAWQRRGVVGQYDFASNPNWRATGDKKSLTKQWLKYGWWAWNSGQRSTAIAYGLRALRLSPTSAGPWKLLLCAATRPMPRQAAA